MLFKAFLTLLAVGVVMCLPDNCHSRMDKECEMSKLPMDLPDTVEELKQDCNDMQQVFTCVLDVFKHCSASSMDIDMMETLLKYIEENCDEESNVYKVISSNLECVTRTAKTFEEKCSIDSLRKEDRGPFLDLYSTLAEKYGHICVEVYTDVVCYSHIMGQTCGSEEKDVTADILSNVMLNYRACNTTNLADFQPLKEFIELKFGENNIIEDIIFD